MPGGSGERDPVPGEPGEITENGTGLRFGKQKLEFCDTNTTQLIVGKKLASSPIHNLFFTGKLRRPEVE